MQNAFAIIIMWIAFLFFLRVKDFLFKDIHGGGNMTLFPGVGGDLRVGIFVDEFL